MTDTCRDIRALLRLNLLDYILRPRVLRFLYQDVYSGDLDAFLSAGVSEWETRVRFTDAEKKTLARVWPVSEEKIEKDRDRLAHVSSVIIGAGDARYPALLKEIPDYPLVLFARGRLECLAVPHALAVVGSRDMSPYGARAIQTLLADFEGGPCLISGLALGVDAAVHAFALDRDLPTIGVLGCGVDTAYPPENADLAARMLERSLILSEFPLGAPPLAHHFPRRNRVIAGLSLGVLVVEAALRSGSLITARLAMEYNREVFAVPGSVESRTSEGCHRLIAQGARLAAGARDLAAEIPGLHTYLRDRQADAADAGATALCESRRVDVADLNPNAQALHRCFETRSRWHIDELVESLACLPPVLFPHLMELEARGYLRAMPGQWYERRAR